MKTGAAYRAVSDKDTSEYKCFRDEKNEMFRIGDFIFLDVDSSYPYVIGKVESFRMVGVCPHLLIVFFRRKARK